MDLMRRFNPRFAPFVTVSMAVIVNGLQLLLCAAAMALRERTLVLSMSVAGLLLVNGLVHIAACIRLRGYAPGVLTALFLYLPLSVYAYYHWIRLGQLTAGAVIATAVLGLLYQAVPIGYLILASMKSRAAV